MQRKENHGLGDVTQRHINGKIPMKLSIVTINYNNAAGLRNTLASVTAQTYFDIEHIIVDAASSDGSVDIIKEYATKAKYPVLWSSKKDNGIYNGMNIGIMRATGDYIQILNSGDLLASDDVIERIMGILKENNYPELLYGNAVDVDNGKRLSSHGPEIEYSLLSLYQATYPHDSTFFKKELFCPERYGLYDESLKIVSDWKWYLQVVGLGGVKPIYVDIDVALFDVHGISSTNKELNAQERRKVLKELLPSAILVDYDKYSFPIQQYNRLKKYHLWVVVYLIERVLFKFEKWKLLR